MLLEAVEEMIEELAEEIAQAATLPPLKLYVAANATMLHLLFDVDCSTIGVAPYRAAFLEGKKVPSFIKGVSEIESLPSIHAFVGADIVAGMCRVGQPMEGKYHLLVDLGTNAEVVLFKKGRALATAAAAGPCFEGANITNGMSATRGAICAFRREAGKDVMQTIADAAPEGICGSGLIDLIAELVRAEEIDETGFLECEEYILCQGATESALQTEGVLQSEAKAEQKAGKRVALTVGDVRQFQLAKAAVCAAIETMLHIEQITEQEIETIYLSGGFSTSIDIDNAMEVGLLPKSMAGKCVAINNSSLQGCVKYALGECEPKDFLEGAEYVDLSTHAKFGELFIDRMGFEK
jgi:uncharacterized 2Fe-2S/4Fe-4S cluster protein (DUF4445 family)